MTNDRRKTFNTPLEFWQWAIQFPGKRKATWRVGCEPVTIVVRKHGHLFADGNWPSKDNEPVPLTAVEDEHGAIPEAEKAPKRSAYLVLRELFTAEQIEALAELADQAVKSGAGKIADERIAAATVIERGNSGVMIPLQQLRLKPKGDL